MAFPLVSLSDDFFTWFFSDRETIGAIIEALIDGYNDRITQTFDRATVLVRGSNKCLFAGVFVCLSIRLFFPEYLWFNLCVLVVLLAGWLFMTVKGRGRERETYIHREIDRDKEIVSRWLVNPTQRAVWRMRMIEIMIQDPRQRPIYATEDEKWIHLMLLFSLFLKST